MLLKQYLWVFLLSLLVGCSGANQADSSGPDVLFVQMQDFNRAETVRLVKYLQDRHGLDVLWTGPLDFAPVMYVPARNQYLADEIARVARNAVSNKGLEKDSLTIIVLTHKDLNTRGFAAPYLIAAHFDRNNISVISTARIDPVNYGAQPDRKLLQERLEKLVNKSVGLHHYHYPVSDDPGSVMFGPVTTPAELDGVAEWYEEQSDPAVKGEL